MIYDAVVIGGGPAGIMAAGRASERGARVLLLEKNNKLGLKLLATGHGRCNVTNTSADDKQKISIYGPNSKFLFSAFNKFSVNNVLNFFNKLGVSTKIENHGRVFPESDQATDIQLALIKYLEKDDVEIRYNAEVKKVVGVNDKIDKVVLMNGEEILSKNFIIASGGKSYPDTGSTGDGYTWLANLNHSINTPRPALTPVVVKEKIVEQLEGLSFKDIGLNIYQNKKKLINRSGDIIFTADGISGPAIIDLSSKLGTLLPGLTVIKIDFYPETTKNELKEKMQHDFHHSNNKMIKNYLSVLTSPRLVSVILELTNINEKKPVSTVTKKERQGLVDMLKEFTLEVKELKDFNRAMITAGGLDIKEVDSKTMRSKLYSNLLLAGEVLDLDGPSGGYNLQICWSTGYLAGDSIDIDNG